jgi:hypothetical protein
MAFDPALDGGRGPLIPQRVTRLFRNVTETVLSVNGVLTTPGHHWLGPDGQMEAVERLFARGGQVVNAAGRAVAAQVELYRFGEATADRFEVATDWVSPEAGALALKPEIMTGWRTYNFEVEQLHTYVAGGHRVHNLSAPSFVPLDGNGERLPSSSPNSGSTRAAARSPPASGYITQSGDEHLLQTTLGPDGNRQSCGRRSTRRMSGHVRDWRDVSVVDNASGALDTVHRYDGNERSSNSSRTGALTGHIAIYSSILREQ